MKICIVCANYYPEISKNLLNGASKVLKKNKINKYKKIFVSGAFEIPIIISRNINKYREIYVKIRRIHIISRIILIISHIIHIRMPMDAYGAVNQWGIFCDFAWKRHPRRPQWVNFGAPGVHRHP